MTAFVDWDQYFITMAYLVAMKSKDQSTHIGSVLVGEDHQVISTGYNSLPRGFDDSRTDVNVRPLKYQYYEHSERNAIFNSALTGVSTKGSILYTLAYPCSDCARAIVQSGIREVVVHGSNSLQEIERWKESMAVSIDIFESCGVEFRVWEGSIPELMRKMDGATSVP